MNLQYGKILFIGDLVPPTGLEPVQPAPEAGALSI